MGEGDLTEACLCVIHTYTQSPFVQLSVLNTSYIWFHASSLHIMPPSPYLLCNFLHKVCRLGSPLINSCLIPISSCNLFVPLTIILSDNSYYPCRFCQPTTCTVITFWCKMFFIYLHFKIKKMGSLIISSDGDMILMITKRKREANT